MGKRYNNTVTQYVLITCLAVVLLFAQMFKLHIHIQHDEMSEPAGHVVDVHAASSLHDTTYDAHHLDNVPNHHFTDIKIFLDGVVKKVGLFNIFVLLFVIASIIIMRVSRLRCIRRRYIFKTKLDSLYYLLQPPLRAPPV